MSAQSGSIISIALGAILGVIAIAVPGAQPLLGVSAALLIGTGALGLAYKPKVTDGQSASNQEFKISPASVGNPVPVPFGEVFVTPNYLRYESSTYETEPYYGEVQSAGKGGKKKTSQVKAGDKHKSVFELGLCKGPIDAIGQVYSTPGETPMLEGDDPWVEFTDGIEELTFAPQGTEGDFQGGVVRAYDGRLDQLRDANGDPYAGDGMNYRGTAWLLMGAGPGKFCTGITSYPKTYRVKVRRLPKCIRDDGSVVTGIKTRGSDDENHPAYRMANPVAMIYECLTNKQWGRRLSHTIFNEANAIAVSQKYCDMNIGMSILLDSTTSVVEFINGIFEHCKCNLNWDGDVYTFQNLLDIATTHGDIQTLDESDLSDFTVSVATWEDIQNELRAEYTDPRRGDRGNIAHVQSEAAIDILDGRRVGRRVQLTGFNDLNLAYQQAMRLLSETAYPFRVVSWVNNRFKSQMKIGQVQRIFSRDYTEGYATSYWMILKIDYGDSQDDTVKVTAVEDSILPPVEGKETSVTLPDKYAWEHITAVDPADYDLSIPPINPEEIPPPAPETTLVMELPPIATGGLTSRTVIGVERWPAISGVYARWSTDNVKFREFEGFGGMGGSVVISLALVDALPGNQFFDRSPEGFEMLMTQTHPPFIANNGIVLARANLVDVDTDHLEDLLQTNSFFAVIGEEIIQIGKIDDLGGGSFRMRNIIRGRFGSRIVSHVPGETVFYSERQLQGINVNLLPQNREIWYQVRYQTYRGAAITFDVVQTFHEAPNDHIHLGVGIRPIPPSYVSIVDGGATVTLKARPRFYDTGAGVLDFITAMKQPVQSLGEMTFAVAQVNASGTLLDNPPVPVAHTYFAGGLDAPSYVEVTVTKKTNAKKFRLYSMLGGQTSVNYIEYAI